MKKMLNNGLTLTLCLLALATISAKAQVDLYLDDANGNIGVVDLDISQPADSTVSVLGNAGVAISDIAFTSNGDLYGTTHTALYSLSTSDGAASFVGNYGGAGASNIVGLVGSGDQLYASSYGTWSIYAIDADPFSITALKGTTNGYSQGDLSFGTGATASTLYDTLKNGQLSEITISGNTISSTVIGTAGSQTISGLATDSAGQVFAVTGTEIYILDTANNTLQPFFNYSGHGLGQDAGAAILDNLVVPEPSTYVLLLAGCIGLALFQSRTRALARV